MAAPPRTGAPWFVDGHLDLALLAQEGRDLLRAAEEPARQGVTLPALAAGDVRVVLGTLFTQLGAPGERWGYRDHDDLDGARRAALDQLSIYERLERDGHIRLVRWAADLPASPQPGQPLAVILLMEGGDPIAGPADVAWWFERGVRAVGLSWSQGSRWSGGNARPGGLAPGGREVVAALDEAGILHDASHLSDQALEELLEVSERPVVASHSNARALMDPSERHLRDDHARRLVSRGGVVGLNLYGRFLASGRPATLDDAVRHLEHWCQVVGESNVVLGSDLDGGFTPAECPPGASRPEELPAFARMLGERGWGRARVESFAHGAWMRVLARCLPRR